MQKVFSALNEFDMHKLSLLYADWPSLQIWEKFAVLRSIFLMRENQRSYQLLEQHAGELNSLGIYDLLKLSLEQEILIHYQSAFSAAISSASFHEKHPYLRGEFYFTLGLSLLRQRQAHFALPFYKRSMVEYQAARMPPLVWRSEYNIALCYLSLGMEEKFVEQSALIENHFLMLAENAQRNLMHLLAWLYVHQRKYRATVEIISQSLLRWENDITLKNRIAWEGQRIYCQLKKNEPPQLDPHIADRERSVFVKEMIRIENSPSPRKMDEIKLRLQFWISCVDEISILHLADLTLRKILKEKNYHLLGEASAFLHKQVPHFPISPEDLRGYLLLSRFALNRQAAFHGLFTNLRQSLPNRTLKPFLSELRSLRNENKLVSLKLDLGQSQLQIGKRSFSLSKRPKILELLRNVLSCKRGIPIDALSHLLYPHVAEDEGRFRIRTLLYRTKKISKDFDFLLLENGILRLSPKFHAKIILQKSMQTKRRRAEQIVSVLKSAKTPLSISEISDELRLKRRTLQLDLQQLVADGKLRRYGRKRSARYGFC